MTSAQAKKDIDTLLTDVENALKKANRSRLASLIGWLKNIIDANWTALWTVIGPLLANVTNPTDALKVLVAQLEKEDPWLTPILTVIMAEIQPYLP